MATTDITSPLNRMAVLAGAVTNVGLVHKFDLYSRKDMTDLLVSRVAGVDTMRAWWFTGPTMVGRPMVQHAGGFIERTWRWTIHGVEGLSADGQTSLASVRSFALAIADAIDAEPDLSGACHRSQPASLVSCENRAAWRGVGVSYAQLVKEVVTLTTP